MERIFIFPHFATPLVAVPNDIAKKYDLDEDYLEY